MDWVRYFLATAVVVAHYNLLAGNTFPYPITSPTAVGIFFGLSGFLVYASYERCGYNIRRYVAGRARRILPPYLFVVLACAVLLSAVSSLPAREYFTSIGFWKYLFANVTFMNFLQPQLPGVFEQSVMNAVNGSLWTIKVEWMLYLSIPLLGYVVHRFRWNTDYVVAFILLFSVAYGQFMMQWYLHTGNELYRILSYQFIGQMVYFYTGALMYRHLKWVSTHKAMLFALCCIVLAAAHLAKTAIAPSVMLSMLLRFIEPAASVCLALIICISRPVLGSLVQRLGNCSYEIYLFHFPIIQLMVLWAVPSSLNPITAFGLALTIIFVFSFLYNKGYTLAKEHIHHTL